MSETTTRENKNSVFTQGTDTQGQGLNTDQQALAAKHGVPSQHVRSQQDELLAELGIQIPMELVPLPSQGLVYPPGTALHRKELVEIKAMTAKEEDILTSKAYIKNGTVITKLVQSCLADKSVDVKNMLSGDRNALLVAIRITGYGAEYSGEIQCPACDNRWSHTFNLAELPLKNLTLEPVASGQNLFEFTLPVTGAKVQFKFLTGHDEEEIAVTSERRKKKLKLQEDNLVTMRLQHQIVAVNGRTDRTLINKFVNFMPAGDSLALRNYISDNEPGIEMKDTIGCPSLDCGEYSEVDVPLGVTFFWPNASK